MFKPASKSTLHENVLNQIIEAIKKGVWEPGMKLPGEQSLAKTFGVSRNCIREVLKALELSGIVEAHPGDGTYLSLNALRNIANMEFVANLFEESTLKELVEARSLLEGQIAYWAAERATSEEIEKLEKLLLENEKNPDADIHNKFHNILAEMAGNRFILRLLESIRNELATQRLIFKNFSPEALKQHRKENMEICQAIKNRDSEKAREIIHRHVSRGQDEILERLHKKSKRTKTEKDTLGSIKNPN
ncbi:MAG: FadR/GntR family transcriptional regulator [Aminobacterium sp.]|uniref:FadR/GntR family transcriptional regulator n=1 Tax=unclassified Aminobacterium TaxID=2685012 RepID=UPI001BCDD5CF|nr:MULTISPECIES: FadR/GntR family transcriptional regulator [unclassified Aminobacterium]MDD2206898.1 FadR/GntR family transcriptional regulator [Aminobacterium sp.]MDD3707944.1 FadR/GntR family transcriptional regulator [Aminobacterium sp.]MDD4550981.1 FadR/GntR family transcriptional regulator [Aminobacterium sp.]MEA4877970.1 FadR/GntR family transcriptional regulator [Aminobacterium sp.]WMI71599.1 FadR/GntR family transcriptional regulator [Aminobacterium sp. MB27-C1]